MTVDFETSQALIQDCDKSEGTCKQNGFNFQWFEFQRSNADLN